MVVVVVLLVVRGRVWFRVIRRVLIWVGNRVSVYSDSSQVIRIL
jgi:hypothetical protein